MLILYEEENLKIAGKINMRRATNFLLGLPNPKLGQRGGYFLLSYFRSRPEGMAVRSRKYSRHFMAVRYGCPIEEVFPTYK